MSVPRLALYSPVPVLMSVLCFFSTIMVNKDVYMRCQHHTNRTLRLLIRVVTRITQRFLNNVNRRESFIDYINKKHLKNVGPI